MLDPLLALGTAPALVRMTMATDTATSVSAWAAIGSVIVTLVLAVLTGAYVWQTRSMARAAVDSARVAEASAEHAARSADAAERSLISSNMPALLASWVSDSSELRGAEFDVRNDGRSPAINVHITYDDQKERIGDFDPGERRKMRRAAAPS